MRKLTPATLTIELAKKPIGSGTAATDEYTTVSRRPGVWTTAISGHVAPSCSNRAPLHGAALRTLRNGWTSGYYFKYDVGTFEDAQRLDKPCDHRRLFCQHLARSSHRARLCLDA